MDAKTRNQKTLLAMAQDYVRIYFDEFAMIQLLEWKRVGERSVEKGEERPEEFALPFIEAVEEWKNQVMADYLLIRKPNLQSGAYVDFSNNGAPPVTFTDIFLVINVHMRPTGWVVPTLEE